MTPISESRRSAAARGTSSCRATRSTSHAYRDFATKTGWQCSESGTLLGDSGTHSETITLPRSLRGVEADARGGLENHLQECKASLYIVAGDERRCGGMSRPSADIRMTRWKMTLTP